MKSIEVGRSFLQEIFCDDGLLLVVVLNTANMIFAACAHAKIKVSFVIVISFIFCLSVGLLFVFVSVLQ